MTVATSAQGHDVLPGSGHGVPGVHGPADVAGFETGFGPAPFFNHVGEGADFVKAGVTTRRQITHKGQPGQTDPFVLLIPPLPPGAVLVDVFISWNYLLNGPPPVFDTIIVNGVAVTGQLCGSGSPDLCWGKEGAATYIVSGFGPDLPIDHGGGNSFGLATDKPLGADPRAYGEGLSVLCVYDVPGQPVRNVDVYCGYTSTESDPARTLTANARMGFSNGYLGGDLHFFLNALDGQQDTADCPGFGDDFFIDGVLVSGLVAGTGVVGDAWQGFLGPNGISDLYDHANDDIAPLGIVPVGALGLTATTVRPDFGDCIGHSFGAVSFPLQDTPDPWTCWSPGSPCSDGSIPTLVGAGPLTPGSANSLTVCGPPFAPAFLVVGLSPLRVPFKGGILGPKPDIVINLVLDAAGKAVIPFVWPAGIPAGTCIWFQVWIPDSGVPSGFCSTKTVKGTAN